jgi:flagellar basal body-associated protein FliL
MVAIPIATLMIISVITIIVVTLIPIAMITTVAIVMASVRHHKAAAQPDHQQTQNHY